MKKDEKIDINRNLPKEEFTEYKIEISDYDSQNAYLEFEEELDKKAISYIEREVRNSYEYRSYVNYLKEELDLTKCSLLPNLDINKIKNISLEFHHYPMNLFEITEAVGKKMISDAKENEKVSCFDIAEQVVAEHYKNNIGLVPLTKTLHDMAHNKAIIIPFDKINGNYKNFLVNYDKYISEDVKERIKEAEILNLSDSENIDIYNKTKLEKNISHYNSEYNKKKDEGGNSNE